MMRRDPPLRLLLVEDDAEAGAELAELLEAHGATVSLAITVDEALRLAPGTDLALVDLELGAESGASLAAGWDARPGMPAVVLLSGRALTSSEAARFRAGPPPLLGKPIDLAQLLAVVNRLLP